MGDDERGEFAGVNGAGGDSMGGLPFVPVHFKNAMGVILEGEGGGTGGVDEEGKGVGKGVKDFADDGGTGSGREVAGKDEGMSGGGLFTDGLGPDVGEVGIERGAFFDEFGDAGVGHADDGGTNAGGVGRG